MARDEVNNTEDITLLVEFPEDSWLKGETAGGVHAEKSREVLDSALEAIHALAQKTVKGIKTLTDPPDSIKISFGLKLDPEGGAIISQKSSDSAIQVSLSWTGEKGTSKPSRVGFISQGSGD